jgi:hypothetical protein
MDFIRGLSDTRLDAQSVDDKAAFRCVCIAVSREGGVVGEFGRGRTVDCTVESTERTTCRRTRRGWASEAASTAATVTPDTLRPTTSNLSLHIAPDEGSGALGCKATAPESSAYLSRRGTCHLQSFVVWPNTAVPASPEHANFGTATIDSGIGNVTSTFSPCHSHRKLTKAILKHKVRVQLDRGNDRSHDAAKHLEIAELDDVLVVR